MSSSQNYFDLIKQAHILDNVYTLQQHNNEQLKDAHEILTNQQSIIENAIIF